MARSNEPIVWSLFAAGGVVAAMVGPALICLIGFAALFGWQQAFDFEHVRTLFSHTLVKLVLFVIIVLPMFHWAHRFRFVLSDLGLRPVKTPLAVLCYGIAIAATALAGIVLARL